MGQRVPVPYGVRILGPAGPLPRVGGDDCHPTVDDIQRHGSPPHTRGKVLAMTIPKPLVQVQR